VALRKSILDPADPSVVVARWRRGLPELNEGNLTVRPVRVSDASSLTAQLSDRSVWRYTAPCPPTVEAMTRFIQWADVERRRGKFACFGIIPAGSKHAVGVIQVWPVERDFSTAKWGFALGRSFWGSGLLVRAARLVLDVVFNEVGVYRLEARVVDVNRQGNRVLEKLGARRDGILRGAFHDGPVVRNHVMWSILATDVWTSGRRTRDGR
jgi:ribosomal-protein-alanine N-acetyltransferase